MNEMLKLAEALRPPAWTQLELYTSSLNNNSNVNKPNSLRSLQSAPVSLTSAAISSRKCPAWAPGGAMLGPRVEINKTN